jgi:hypothetical protein
VKRLCLAFATILALAGCGGNGHHATTAAKKPPRPPQLLEVSPTACPSGNSFMGCAAPPALGIIPRVTAPAGRRFVDVSDWQPSVNWGAVRASGIFAVVVKAGEGLAQDPTFASHVAGARAAGLQVQAYWFERPVGCSSEAAAIDRVVPHGMRVTFDAEVSGVAGYASCERAAVQAHTGLVPAVYTAPGTWPGGSSAGLPLWEATYGPSLKVLWRPLASWQFTQSAVIPGIPGFVDESVDYGLFAAPKPTPKPDPQHYERYPANAPAKPNRERASVEGWDVHRCELPTRRPVCKITQTHLAFDLGRDQTLYARDSKALRNELHLPGRIQGVVRRLTRRGVVNGWL